MYSEIYTAVWLLEWCRFKTSVTGRCIDLCCNYNLMWAEKKVCFDWFILSIVINSWLWTQNNKKLLIKGTKQKKKHTKNVVLDWTWFSLCPWMSRGYWNTNQYLGILNDSFKRRGWRDELTLSLTSESKQNYSEVV